MLYVIMVCREECVRVHVYEYVHVHVYVHVYVNAYVNLKAFIRKTSKTPRHDISETPFFEKHRRPPLKSYLGSAIFQKNIEDPLK